MPPRRNPEAAKPEDSLSDRAYLYAFRNGFDKRYSSSPVKKYTPEEIAAYSKRNS